MVQTFFVIVFENRKMAQVIMIFDTNDTENMSKSGNYSVMWDFQSTQI